VNRRPLIASVRTRSSIGASEAANGRSVVRPLWVDATNEASRKVAERAGYTLEGLLRSYAIVHDRRADAALYALLPEDIQELRGLVPGVVDESRGLATRALRLLSTYLLCETSCARCEITHRAGRHTRRSSRPRPSGSSQ
jgi:hypothetical protein